MAKRPGIFQRILSRFKGRKDAAPAPAPDKPGAPKERPKKPLHSSFEPLEGRIAPAILLNPSTVQYRDVDGDLVTVRFSKAIFAEGTGLNAQLDRVFKFDTGNVRADGNADSAQVLQTLDLTGVTTSVFEQGKSPVNGASISITADTAGGAGDGLVDVGYVKATLGATNGIVLGKVLIEGDLGRIDAGTALKPVGVKSLVVNSMGVRGTTTQASGGTLNSTVYGVVESLSVNDDFKDAIFRVENGNFIGGKTLPGNIGALRIGGKIFTTTNLAATDAGSIVTDGNIGSVVIGTLPDDGIFGGTGQGSGRVHAGGKIGTVAIQGDIRGSAGKDSGQISADRGMGDVTLRFSLFAGAGENSGRIVSSSGTIGKISLQAIRGEASVDGGASGKNSATISAPNGIAGLKITHGEAIRGGAGEGSGSVSAVNGSIGPIVIAGSVQGGAGASSARIFAGVDIASATIGIVTGGGGNESALLRAGDDIGVVTVASLNGGAGNESGGIRVGDRLQSLVVFRTISGGAGDDSGAVRAADIGAVTVQNTFAAEGALVAGAGQRSGYIEARTSAGKVKVIGSLDGTTSSADEGAGSIVVGGNVGTISVSGSLLGGAVAETGAIVVRGKAASVSIGGNLVGGSGAYSGSISVEGALTTAAVVGNLAGGGGVFSGSIVVGTDFTVPAGIKSLNIGGTLTGGSGINSAVVSAGGAIGVATLGKSAAAGSDVIKGGSGGGSGGIFGGGGLGVVKVLGNLAGGDGTASGTVRAGGVAAQITISGGISGGSGSQSGSVRILDAGDVGGILSSLTAGALLGGSGDDSGQIYSDGSIAKLSISQSNGASGARSGSIIAGFGTVAADEGLVKAGRITNAKIGADAQAGAGTESGSIIAAGSLKTLSIGGAATGSVISAGREIGSITAASMQGVRILALGQAVQKSTDLAIARITIVGTISGSEILAGFDRFGNATNGNAQIGTVIVGGDWAGTSMAAGVEDTDADGFGDEDDAAVAGASASIISRIASVKITGEVLGRADASQVGFVARQIDSIRIGGTSVALTPAKNTIVLATNLNEITIREVA